MREIQQTKHEFEGGIKLSVIGKRDIDKDDLVFNPVSKLPDSPVHRLGIVILHIDLEHLTERYFQVYLAIQLNFVEYDYFYQKL
jgi:hypothetical protein